MPIYGTPDADLIPGTVAAETIYGYGGDDTIFAFGGNDTIQGNAGNDRLSGDDGADTLYGGNGNDRLAGGTGADTLNGGGDIDIADYQTSATGVNVLLYIDDASGGDAAGDELNSIENVMGSAHADQLWGDDGVNLLWGMSGNDLLKGFGGSDQLFGGNGSDTLEGGDGADILMGDAGADQMNGGAGNDTYTVDHAGDVITETGGQGSDEVVSFVSYALTAGADVEVLHTGSDAGAAPINLTGNETGNLVCGNAGANVINGGDGNDELTGLGGEDSFMFNTPLDETFNVDEITDFNVTDDTILLDATIFSSDLSVGNSVAGSQFVIGAEAENAVHRIIYNDETGAVYYDSDGTGGAAQIQFAELSPGLALENFDFFVVA
jgi:Ca2+-binding RTX toxin-like protein